MIPTPRSFALDPTEIRHAYQRVFASGDGQVVLQHLLDTLYNTVYEGTDLHEAFAHSMRRTVIHDMMDNLRPDQPQEDLHAG